MNDNTRKKQTKKPDINREADGKFKQGNTIWMKAGYPGRPRKFETAEELWIEANKYFEWAVKTPIDDYVIQGGKRIKAPKTRPFTIIELCHFMNCSGQYLNEVENRTLGKTDPLKADYDEKEAEFSVVVKHMKDIVFNQKYQGAAIGMFKENLIARDIGLHESVNNKLYSGNDEPLKSQISIIQLPDNGRPVKIPGSTESE